MNTTEKGVRSKGSAVIAATGAVTLLSVLGLAGLTLRANICSDKNAAPGLVFRSVPAVHGTVTDAETGAPLKDVLLRVRISKVQIHPAGMTTLSSETRYLRPDAAGRYRLPRVRVWHLMPVMVDIDAYHPLYGRESAAVKANGVGGPYDTTVTSVKEKGGFRYDIAMRSLDGWERLYLRSPRPSEAFAYSQHVMAALGMAEDSVAPSPGTFRFFYPSGEEAAPYDWVAVMRTLERHVQTLVAIQPRFSVINPDLAERFHRLQSAMRSRYPEYRQP